MNIAVNCFHRDNCTNTLFVDALISLNKDL